MSDAAAPFPALSVRLRESTRAAHERIESVLDLMRPGLSIDGYARLLERWHGFELTWQRVAPVALGDGLPDGFLAARRKLALLRADLLACGRSPGGIDALPAVPDAALPLADRSAALGVLYVVEGSTLGGQHVAKFVHAHLGLTPQHGLAYFTSYGPDVGVRWRETKTLIDAPPFGIDAGQVVVAANATFDYLATWLAPSPDNVTSTGS